MSLVDEISRVKYYENVIEPINKSFLSKQEYISNKVRNEMVKSSNKDFYNNLNKVNKIFVTESKELLEGKIENIRIRELKHLKLPFRNFFIEYKENKYFYGIHFSKDLEINKLMKENGYIIRIFRGNLNENDKSKSSYDIKNYIETVIEYNSLPIIKNCCLSSKDCCNKEHSFSNNEIISNFKNSNFLVNKDDFLDKSRELCERTVRSAENCENGRETIKALKIFIYAINRINNRNIELRNKNNVNFNKKDNNSLNNLDTATIEIKSKAIRYIYDENTKSVIGGLKVAHNRRGHFRHYKSGEIVWINESNIHGNDKIIKRVYNICS